MIPVIVALGVFILSAFDLSKNNVAGCHGGVTDFAGMAITASPNHYMYQATFLPGFSVAPKPTFVDKSLLLALPEPNVCSPCTKGYPFLSTVVSTMDDAPTPVIPSTKAPILFASAWTFSGVTDSLVVAITVTWDIITRFVGTFSYVIWGSWFLFFAVLYFRISLDGAKAYFLQLLLLTATAYTSVSRRRNDRHQPSRRIPKHEIRSKEKTVLTICVDAADLCSVTVLVKLLRLSESTLEQYAETHADRVKLAQSMTYYFSVLIGMDVRCKGGAPLSLGLDMVMYEEKEVLGMFSGPKAVGFCLRAFAMELISKGTEYGQQLALEGMETVIVNYLSMPHPLRKVAFLVRGILVIHAAYKAPTVSMEHTDRLHSLIDDFRVEFGVELLVFDPLLSLLREMRSMRFNGEIYRQHGFYTMQSARASVEILLAWIAILMMPHNATVKNAEATIEDSEAPRDVATAA